MRDVRSLFLLLLIGTAALQSGLPFIGAAPVAATLPAPQPSQPTAAAPAEPAVLAQAAQRRVKVYFPRNPRSQNDLSYVEPVWRQVASTNPIQIAVRQVVAGPTRAERRAGFTVPIQLSGSSNCGDDFRLAVVGDTAMLKFCRSVVSAGIGDDARIKSSLTATLKQFSSIRSVILLDRNGNCLGDMSGENRCLK